MEFFETKSILTQKYFFLRRIERWVNTEYFQKLTSAIYATKFNFWCFLKKSEKLGFLEKELGHSLISSHFWLKTFFVSKILFLMLGPDSLHIMLVLRNLMSLKLSWSWLMTKYMLLGRNIGNRSAQKTLSIQFFPFHNYSWNVGSWNEYGDWGLRWASFISWCLLPSLQFPFWLLILTTTL